MMNFPSTYQSCPFMLITESVKTRLEGLDIINNYYKIQNKKLINMIRLKMLSA